MNATLRGLSVLVLLCLLPRASALTIVQTVTGAASAQGQQPIASLNWSVAQFDSNLGTLTSVRLDVQWTGQATNTDYNTAGGVPLSNNPVLSVTGWYIVRPGIEGGSSTPATYVKGPNDPDYIAPFGTVTYSMDFDLSRSADLGFAAFLGTGRRDIEFFARVATGGASTGAIINQNTSATLTYSYAIPDAGSAALLTAGSIGACLLIYRRKRIGEGDHARRV